MLAATTGPSNCGSSGSRLGGAECDLASTLHDGRIGLEGGATATRTDHEFDGAHPGAAGIESVFDGVDSGQGRGLLGGARAAWRR